MKTDVYRICANCENFKSTDRYHGVCRLRSEIRAVKGVVDMTEKRVRWNSDARNCEDFSGVIG